MQSTKSEMLRHLGPGANVFSDPSTLNVYSFDQGEVPPSLRKLLVPDTRPDIVVQPGTIEDLQQVVRFAGDRSMPVIPRGASTFGLGGAVAHRGGILLDFSTRREIYHFDPNAETIRVGAGCRWSDASHYLESFGFDLLPYPTSWFSTVGGWASTGGVGIGCTRYGSFHDWVESLTVVTPSGQKRVLSRNNPDMQYFLGTEGQMGAIWDITFKIRRKPSARIPFLLLVDELEAAFEIASEIIEEFDPYHLKFLDAARIHEINHLLREEHPSSGGKTDLPENLTLLLCFDSQEEAVRFRRWVQQKGLALVQDYRAHLLWRERMFPLRVKRVAPGLLASELILPVTKLAAYVQVAREAGKKFKVALATECYFLNDGTALTLPVYTFRAGGAVDESIKSALAFVLTQTGIAMGGRPYGIGIWNSPFLKSRYNGRLKDLTFYKQSNDPDYRFNPGKFFDLSFRAGFAGRLASLPLHPSMIPAWTKALSWIAPLLTRVGRGERPEDLVALNEELCSKCGSCIPVCPAYIDTLDERTTARGKLRLGKQLMEGTDLSKEEANVLFLCMHCSACTDVCQSRLDLVPVWDELERRVEKQYGKDVPRVKEFVESVERKKIMGVPYARGAKVVTGNQPE